jgi:hypothetical protein
MYAVKISASPRGLVKVSHGVCPRERTSPELNLPLAVDLNFNSPSSQEIQEHLRGIEEGLWEIASDIPPDALPRKIRAGWGGLGNKVRASAKSCRALADRMAAVELWADDGVFVTLTLPHDNPDTYEALARQSSYVVNRLSQYLRNNYPEGIYARCGAWEYQKRGALHYHLYLGIQSEFWDYFLLNENAFSLHGCNTNPSQFPMDLMGAFRSRIASEWEKILDSIGDIYSLEMIKPEYRGRILDYSDLGRRFANCQIVEKSVSAYLSGYLTDSNHKNKNGLRGRFFPIATWFQWDRKATELYKEYSYSDTIYVEDYESFLLLREVLFASLEKCDGTEEINTKNPFYESHCCLSKMPIDFLIALVRDWGRDLGILAKQNIRRFKLKWEDRRIKMISQARHDIELDRFDAIRRNGILWGEYCRKNLHRIGLDLLAIGRFCTKILADEKTTIYHQLELL